MECHIISLKKYELIARHMHGLLITCLVEIKEFLFLSTNIGREQANSEGEMFVFEVYTTISHFSIF